jgi:2,4-didehydro-3-deoxy-L-rhamnonate hydrolase
MKLLRYGKPGKEKPGLLDAEGNIRDLSDKIDDIDGRVLSHEKLAKIAGYNIDKLPIVKGKPRLGPPVAHVSKLVCCGLNYSDHAAETGATVPPEPVLFMKATTCIVGPNDDVMLPKGSKKTDWEVELGVVIGTTARYVTQKDALSHVAGYTIVNDVSERAFQIERSGQWNKGKSADTFGPIGPWLVTADEVKDPQKLDMFCDVNDHRFQNGSTKTMVYTVKFLVHYISQFMTLLPGDVIATGTPPGVGLGQKPPLYLKAGDVMHLGIQGLGEQTQTVVPFKL